VTSSSELRRLRDRASSLAVQVLPHRVGSVAPESGLAREIEGFVSSVAASGANVSPADTDGDASARDVLATLLDEWSSRLVNLTGRSFAAPGLAPYEEHDLEKMSGADVKRSLASGESDHPPPPLVGTQIEAGAGLQKVDLRRASVVECRFTEADFTEARFGPMTVLTRVRFVECDLRRVAAVGVDWNDEISPDAGGLRVISPVFEDCDFASADFRYATFAWGVFHGMRYDGALRPKRRAGQMLLDFAMFAVCDLRDVTLHASLERATFVDCELDGARLVDISAGGATFNRCSLVGADLSGANLAGAIFADCDLREVVMDPVKRGFAPVKTDLSGADLRRVRNLDPLVLLGAKLDGTRVPPAVERELAKVSPEAARGLARAGR
jgi:uncharacterized protein YjbI with pentapeptide repeats